MTEPDDRQDTAGQPGGAGEWKGEERRSRLRRRTDGQDRAMRRPAAAETISIARRDWARGSYLLG